MTELSELQARWAEHDAKLERALALNERLLRETVTLRVRPVMSRYVVRCGFSLTVDVVLIALLGRFLATPDLSVALGVSALAMIVFLIGTAWFSAMCIACIRAMDYGAAVAVLQRSVVRLQRIEFWMFFWVFLGAILLWVPCFAVLVAAFTGLDLFTKFSTSWVLANLIVGIVGIGTGRWWVLRYVERDPDTPFARRVVAGLADGRLKRVATFLRELEELEEDGPHA